MKKFTIAADLSKFISASAPLTNLQHGFFCIFNGTYSGQCSTEIPRKINNAPVGCKLSPFTQRQKPCCTLNKIFWISLEERCDTWQEPIVLSFFSISTSLKIGNQQTIASVSCICNFFLYQPTETPKIYLLFQFRYIHIEELFILNDENYIVLRQWFCSFRSNYRRIFVKSILLVFYLLQFIKNSIKKWYIFAINIIHLVHDIHIKIHTPNKFTTLVCCLWFQFGWSV